MDSNYVYMQAAQKGEEYSNGDGTFWKGLFGGGGDGGSGSGDGQGGQQAAAAGMAILGLATTWLGSRKAKKEAEAQQAAAAQAAMYAQQNQPRKNNTALYAVGGLAVIGIGVAIYFAARKK